MTHPAINVDSNGMVSKKDQLYVIQNAILIYLFNEKFPDNNSEQEIGEDTFAQKITLKIDVLMKFDNMFAKHFIKNNITKSDIAKTLLLLSCHESFSKPEDLIKLLDNVTDEKKRGDIDTFIKHIFSLKEQRKDVMEKMNPSNINQILAEESIENRKNKPSTTINTIKADIKSLQQISGSTSNECIIF